MISQQGQQALFKLWDSMGVDIKLVKYISERFSNWEEFYKLLAKYYNIEGGVMGLKQHIIDDVNQLLSSENSPCDGVKIRLFDIGIEKDMTNRQTMDNYLTHGYMLKPVSYFAYSEPEDWECPEPIAEYPSDSGRFFSEGECFDEYCLMDTMSNMSSYVRKKYGLNLNIQGTPESQMMGNIRIQKY